VAGGEPAGDGRDGVGPEPDAFSQPAWTVPNLRRAPMPVRRIESG